MRFILGLGLRLGLGGDDPVVDAARGRGAALNEGVAVEAPAGAPKERDGERGQKKTRGRFERF